MPKTYCLIAFLILFLAGCGETPQVKTFTPIRADIEQVVPSVVSGITRPVQISELSFGAVGRTDGVFVDIGQTVEKGQVLARLENQDLELSVQVASREMKRQEELLSRKATSPSIVDQARDSYKRALVAFEKSIIRAPFTGIIVEKNLEVGQLSQITAVIPKPLLRMIDMEPRYVRAEIDEIDFQKVKVGQDARIKILSVRKEPFNGKVKIVLPFVSSVREQDRTVQIDLTVESPELLPAGASADVEVITEIKKDALTIPVQAMLRKPGKTVVLLVKEGKLVEQEVKIGIVSYSQLEIVSGVTESDRIVDLSDLPEGTGAGDSVKISG